MNAKCSNVDDIVITTMTFPEKALLSFALMMMMMTMMVMMMMMMMMIVMTTMTFPEKSGEFCIKWRWSWQREQADQCKPGCLQRVHNLISKAIQNQTAVYYDAILIYVLNARMQNIELKRISASYAAHTVHSVQTTLRCIMMQYLNIRIYCINEKNLVGRADRSGFCLYTAN